MSQYSTAQRNHLWASDLINLLSGLGVEHLVACSGSRSAPLAIQAEQQSTIKLHTHIDERGAGFYALGLAKASQAPVAVIVTSGSAVANLLPAVVEAHQTQQPLILLTADRPAELINCGANQAIDQTEIFGSFASAHHLPPPDELTTEKQATLLNELAEQLPKQLSLGPVHLNIPFREPLYLSREEQKDLDQSVGKKSHSSASKTASKALCETAVSLLPNWPSQASKPGIIIAGALQPDEAIAVVAFARQLGWPILADLQSHCRHSELAASHFDLWLANTEAQQALAKAEVRLQFGARLTSKRLLNWLSEYPISSDYLIHSAPHPMDFQRRGAIEVTAGISEWATSHGEIQRGSELNREKLSGKNAQHPVQATVEAWEIRAKSLFAKSSFANSLPTPKPTPELKPENQSSALTELTSCALVYQFACETTKLAANDEANRETNHEEHGEPPIHLMVGNSMPIRLMEMLATPNDKNTSSFTPNIVTNRGASGIDGLLATAVGVATHKSTPTILLLGDMSLLHDLNSLTLLARHRGPMAVVVLNNGGGNIFKMLPVPKRQSTALFEQPVAFELAPICHGFGLTYCQPSTSEQLFSALSETMQGDQPRVIEVITPSGEGVEQMKQLIKDIQELTTHV
ncbi:2-succinyl-5-enolpyruvyl-6-hydroxy-3-cyclohexene-1-carboxylic-acid synthase [Corallincola platygyrae]|uniref:2-succinyl-5-enolpyruvyl-6-hydroxy-3-cyclohexene-1-carboxylate synthase n=1 Tax=Corallincola platygyrae TaxID=1193278 RepID=A0ABW4XL69_9GAMM